MSSEEPFRRPEAPPSEFAAALNRAGRLMELGDFEAAEREYARGVALDPSEPNAQFGLARLRYMRGDARFARDLAAAAAGDRSNGSLQWQFANVLRHSGDLAGAEVLLRDLIARMGSAPELLSSLATVLHAAGRLEEAEIEARAAASARPTDAGILRNWVAVLLSAGRVADALPVIRAQRAQAPLDTAWIADEATAARLMGDSAYTVLYDYERFVRVYDLEPPRGWRSMAELNTRLETLLTVRHALVRQPFDQSMRFGTQTIGDLRQDSDEAIQAVLQAFLEPITDYRARLGDDEGHPLSARSRGESRYAGCWSVLLKQNGFHVNHLHPEGWLSSAYYVAVPAETSDPRARSGWLKFGEPALPVPGATPAFTVQPLPGRLVLFPSYMWHGTTAIHGTEPRLSIAFDVVTGAPR